MNTPSATDEHYMREALKQAKIANDAGEIPVGCVIVSGGRIIARGHNQTETLQDPTAHAEMIAITAATSALGGKYLKDCTVYVTLEPCVMCAGALAWAQADRVVYGATEEKSGFTRISQNLLHPKTQCVHSILEAESRELLVNFFKNKRKS